LRYIDLDGLEEHIPDDWVQEAEELRQNLFDATDSAARKEIINKHMHWNDIRMVRALKMYFHNKCWYTDSRELISDFCVDHFRPVNEVKDENDNILEDHGGYWWEAYNWRNYRLTGKRVNSASSNDQQTETQGKGSYFPLVDESRRANTHTDTLASELPIILDPTEPMDVLLITYGADGVPIPVTPEPDDQNLPEPIDRKRARLTIKYLNLDSPILNGERKNIYRDTKRIVTRINNLADEYAHHHADSVYGELRSEIRSLIKLYKDSDQLELGIVIRHCILVESGQTITRYITSVA